MKLFQLIFSLLIQDGVGIALEWNFNSLHIFSCLLDSHVFFLFYLLSPLHLLQLLVH